jgi:hypothetical protein
MGAEQASGPRTLTDRTVVGAQREAFVKGWVQAGIASSSRLEQAQERAKAEYPLYRSQPKVITHASRYDTYDYKIIDGKLWYRHQGESDRMWTPDQGIDFEFMERILALRAQPNELVKTDE